MMKDIIYKITFYSEWHCGSGLTSGSDLDALVVKDAEGFPYIPGKTIKGLLKEAAVEMIELNSKDAEKSTFITELFGYFDDEKADKSEIHTKGTAFFSNAVLSEDLRKQAKEHGLTNFFFRDMASTAIGDNGIAKKHSLRRMETVIPCQLIASVSGVDDKYAGDLEKTMQWVKRLGQNRHRGLGRCKFEIVKEEEAKI